MSDLPKVHELAFQVSAFLADSSREDMAIILDAVNRGVVASRERERAYAAKCDGAMMAALALASRSRLSPELTRTLSMRVGANLLPSKGRSELEREYIASAIEAQRTETTKTGSVEDESATRKGTPK